MERRQVFRSPADQAAKQLSWERDMFKLYLKEHRTETTLVMDEKISYEFNHTTLHVHRNCIRKK